MNVLVSKLRSDHSPVDENVKIRKVKINCQSDFS